MAECTTETVPIADLHPDPLNPRQMPEDRLAALMRSLTEFGCVQPIVARRSDGLVIGGHQRLAAAQRLGWESVPVVWWAGSDAAARALNLALNQIQGEWDEAQLGTVLAELTQVETLTDALRALDTTWTDVAGFAPADVVQRLAAALDDAPPAEDWRALAEAVPQAERAAPRSAPGQGYALGAHRVWCGDARDADAVAALCAGQAPALLFTDPPYNVAYQAEPTASRAPSGRTTGRRAQPLGPIAEDDLAPDAYQALISDALGNAAAVLAPGGAVYVCGGTTTTAVYASAFADAGLTQSSVIVWDKGHFTVGRRDYQSQYELITYGWRGGAAHRFCGGRQQTDLWAIPRDAGAVYVHPTQKPVALAARAIGNSSVAGDVVLDCFAGSGSTLIAAEQTGRRARCLELDPHYVDVIVARWETYTGEHATPWSPDRTEAAHG